MQEIMTFPFLLYFLAFLELKMVCFCWCICLLIHPQTVSVLGTPRVVCMHQVNYLRFLFLRTSGPPARMWTPSPPHLRPGCHLGPLSPSPLVLLTALLGHISHFLFLSYGLVPRIQEHIFPERVPGHSVI